MKISSLKVFLPILVLLWTTACKMAYQSMDFDEKNLPARPNYAESKSWAVLPGKYPLVLRNYEKIKNEKKADVFYIYPTLLTDKKIKDWNADVWTSSIRQGVFQTALKYQASAWLSALLTSLSVAGCFVFPILSMSTGSKLLWSMSASFAAMP